MIFNFSAKQNWSGERIRIWGPARLAKDGVVPAGCLLYRCYVPDFRRGETGVKADEISGFEPPVDACLVMLRGAIHRAPEKIPEVLAFMKMLAAEGELRSLQQGASAAAEGAASATSFFQEKNLDAKREH